MLQGHVDLVLQHINSIPSKIDLLGNLSSVLENLHGAVQVT